VITEVKAYSSWRSAPTLLLSEGGRSETDLLQVRNIDGIDPVKASVNTSSFGSIDGAAYVGSDVASRNIVLTLHPNPDWDIWTFEKLRKLAYAYFMPKMPIRLVFYSDDIVPVEISGIVEDISPNIFTKDPEYQVSIICPDPYFTALEATIVAGQTIRPGGTPVSIEYNGNIEAGINVQISTVAAPDPNHITIQIGNPAITAVTTDRHLDSSKYFELNSLPMRKYIQTVDLASGVITNVLTYAYISEGPTLWPLLQPGENELSVITEQGTQDWLLSYFEKFGGL
jgi:hypothetical protein